MPGEPVAPPPSSQCTGPLEPFAFCRDPPIFGLSPTSNQRSIAVPSEGLPASAVPEFHELRLAGARVFAARGGGRVVEVEGSVF